MSDARSNAPITPSISSSNNRDRPLLDERLFLVDVSRWTDAKIKAFIKRFKGRLQTLQAEQSRRKHAGTTFTETKATGQLTNGKQVKRRVAKKGSNINGVAARPLSITPADRAYAASIADQVREYQWASDAAKKEHLESLFKKYKKTQYTCSTRRIPCRLDIFTRPIWKHVKNVASLPLVKLPRPYAFSPQERIIIDQHSSTPWVTLDNREQNLILKRVTAKEAKQSNQTS